MKWWFYKFGQNNNKYDIYRPIVDSTVLIFGVLPLKTEFLETSLRSCWEKYDCDENFLSFGKLELEAKKNPGVKKDTWLPSNILLASRNPMVTVQYIF